MLNMIRHIGDWNVTVPNQFNVSEWSLETTLNKLRSKYDVIGLFEWTIDVDTDDFIVPRRIIQRGLTLPTPENYLNKAANADVLAVFLEYMVKVAMLLGANEMEATPQMQAIIDFEARSAGIHG